MRIAGGYAIITGDEGVRETDTFTCAHCNTVVHCWNKRPEEIGGFCRNCMHPICEKCLSQDCIPFEKKLERMEARAAALRSYGA